MLTLSLTPWIGLFLVIAVAAVISYFVFKTKSTDFIDSPDNTIDEEDIFYGSYLDVKQSFLFNKLLSVNSTIQVTLPMPSTPEDHVRAEINHLTFIDIPIKEIIAVHSSEEDTVAYKNKKKHVYEPSSLTKREVTYRSYPTTSAQQDGMALGLIGGTLENAPDQYSRAEESVTVDFGNGGEFAGGGASGSWGDDTPSSDYDTPYLYSSDTSSYSSTDSSSDYSSGSSSYDSGSSDTSSSSSDSW